MHLGFAGIVLYGWLSQVRASSPGPSAVNIHAYSDFPSRNAGTDGRSLEARQAPALPPPQSGDATTLNLSAWNAQTQEACDRALQANFDAGGVTNPSGMAICYNLPFLDNVTGVFQAELRMYNVSAPASPWDRLAPPGLSVALSYLGATAQIVADGNRNITSRERSTLGIGRRELSSLSAIEKRQEPTPQKQQRRPVQTKVLMYVGRINKNLLGPGMNASQLQSLLVPTVKLSARTLSNEEITTTLSSTEASFLMGVFAQSSSKTTDADAERASASAVARKVNPPPLPGVSLGIFPTGMIITGSWAAIFVAAVGWGTYSRIKFRDNYRRRIREKGVGLTRRA